MILCDEKPEKKAKSLTLKDVPKGIYDMLIEEQSKIRKNTGRLVSLEKVIYRLLKKETESFTQPSQNN